MTGYSVVGIADIPPIRDADEDADVDWAPIQHYVGVTAFGVNAFVARRAGAELAADHDEASFGQEEVYIVMAGRVRFVVDGDKFDGAAGTVVAVRDASLKRSAHALEAGSILLAMGCRPGCFETSWNPRHFDGVARHGSVE